LKKEPCILSKEPYILSLKKEPYILFEEKTLHSLKRALNFVVLKEPYILSKKKKISVKRHYLHSA